MSGDRWRCAGGLGLFLIQLTVAQPAASQTSNQDGAPQQTAATYEDWLFRCDSKPGPPPQTVCEIVQFTQRQGQQGPLTQIVIGKPVKGQPTKLLIQVPTNSWLPSGVRLRAGEKDAGVVGEFKWCFATGCIAQIDANTDTIQKFRTAAEGALQLKDASQRELVFPVSFKGFGAAYDALNKK